METPICISCRSTKPRLICQQCQEAVCKHCAHFIDESTFEYSPENSKNFSEGAYCPFCFDSQVAEPLAAYNAVLETAKNVIVFSKEQTKETRYYKRNAAPIKVSDCRDPQEATMKLAFKAIEGGYNGIIDVDLRPQKLIINSYQTTIWFGTAIPTRIDAEKLARLEEVCSYQRNAMS